MVSLINCLFSLKPLAVKKTELKRDDQDTGSLVIRIATSSRRWRLRQTIDEKSSKPSFCWTRVRTNRI